MAKLFPPIPFWGNPTLRACRLLTFLSPWVQICAVNAKKSDNIQGSFQAQCLNRLLLKVSEHFHPDRGSFIVVLMVLKPDNVPLSLRDTGYCHSDHKVSVPAYKVSLTVTQPSL
ncbi:Hypothetical predicted protein [Xyrichtys novacula]|uniref:Uncharacterized protein n=1 Tax=Xyrichtys novacula TaxID=13765 RepID=A0AAV1FTI3_XYRNO|nr:Hypothetical predicted protein [Xyrichtys novacula]